MSLAAVHGLSPARAEALLARYGTSAEKVARAVAQAPEQPLATLPGYSQAEIAWLCRKEPIRRLTDLLFRRTTIAMEGLLTGSAIQETAQIAASTLGWNAERTAREIALASTELAKRQPRLERAA